MRVPVRRSAFLYTDYGEPRLFFPGLAVVVGAFLLTIALVAGLSPPKSAEDKAKALLHSGKPGQAERMYRDVLLANPTAKNALTFLDAHLYAKVFALASAKKDTDPDSLAKNLPSSDGPLPDEEVDTIVDGLPPDVRTIAKFARGEPSPEIREELETGAKRDPPVPYANELLARDAMKNEKLAEAADFYEKEGLSFAERKADVDESLRIRMHLDDWESVRARLADPRVAAAAGPPPKKERAGDDRAW
jgi:hypothetical protein